MAAILKHHFFICICQGFSECGLEYEVDAKRVNEIQRYVVQQFVRSERVSYDKLLSNCKVLFIFIVYGIFEM